PLARHLRRARDRAPLHAALLALDERQGRGVDQDPPARVGVSLRLPDEHAPRPSSRRLPQVVQPTATARLARSPTPDQPCLTRLWSVQLAEAWRRARTPPSGPVYVEVPFDVLHAPAEVDVGDLDGAREPGALPAPAELDRASALLARAERPLLVAGGGTVRSGAGPELLDLAVRLDAPVAT